MTMISTNWADRLDARIADYAEEEYKQTKDLIPAFFTVVGPGDTPQKQDYRFSASGALTDLSDFDGAVVYQDAYEGYDGTITPKEYVTGIQIARKLYDDSLHGDIAAKAQGIGRAVARTRQKHGAQWWNNVFSVDTTWLSHTEGVAMCSNSHTTRAADTSTASGFDNLVTTALSTAAVIAARIQMKGFRDDRGNRIESEGDTLIVPVNLEHTAFEITESMGYPEEVTNARNFNDGRYKVVSSVYFTDTNDWGMADMSLLKRNLIWYERLAYELANVESFDELIGKWRAYARWGQGWKDWRGLLGASVS